MIKPYCTLIGRQWIVLDSNGNERLKTENKNEAFAYLKTHWDVLKEAHKPHEFEKSKRR